MARNGRKGRKRNGGGGSRVPRGVQTNGTNGLVRERGSDRVDGAGGEVVVTTLAAAAPNFITLFLAPGLAGAANQFPRLNTMATLYSQWRWVACTVRYKPICGSTQTGRIVLAATYNAASDVAPTAVAELLDTVPHVAGSVWRNHSLVVPCGRDNFQLNWYPCSPLLAVADADSTVPIAVHIGTDLGVAAAIGTLEFDWVIEFKNPISPNMNPA